MGVLDLMHHIAISKEWEEIKPHLIQGVDAISTIHSVLAASAIVKSRKKVS